MPAWSGVGPVPGGRKSGPAAAGNCAVPVRSANGREGGHARSASGAGATGKVARPGLAGDAVGALAGNPVGSVLAHAPAGSVVPKARPASAQAGPAPALG